MGRKYQRMLNITISLPEIHIEMIETMIALGIIPNRSECIRNAIREFLGTEEVFFKSVTELNKNIEEITK